ncbi:uncharacterized protein LOC129794528 [Lutzomyia longipalpis]|uniref:Putative peritrophin-44 n=1 Tax=Lutzomyia longipalpis TaxID=7200 RepID=A0A1B0CPA3_LUTLO|nr:uncharacterized protein LOC129794528 [Lutzomyia longipalpis]
MAEVLPIILIFLFSVTLVRNWHMGEITTFETNSCEERQTEGIICYSCSVVGVCVLIDQQWHTIPIEECDTAGGYFCNVVAGTCSNASGPCNPVGHERNFVCTAAGIFPDPYDCQMYHMCYRSGNSFGAINVECGGNSAFSVITGDCSITIDNHVCREHQYRCENVGDRGAWPGNSNIFYICKAEVLEDGRRVLYPGLYRCGPSEHFVNNECRLGSPEGHPTLPPSNTCVTSGIFIDPTDCTSYLLCDHDLNLHVIHCPEDSFFNPEILACERGNCTN